MNRQFPSEKATLAEQSFADMCRLVTLLSGHEVQQPLEGVTVYDADFSAFNWYSRICVESLPEDRTEELLSLLSSTPLPLVSFTEGHVPDSFTGQLNALGYVPMVTQTGMLVSLPLSAPCETREDIFRITKEEIEVWSDTVGRAFEKPDDRDAFRLMADCNDCYFYVCKEDGKMIGTTLLYTRNGNAGIHEVGVLKEYRNRGIASALVTRALNDAVSLGAGLSTLQASPAGQSVYSHLGYQEVSRIQNWICPKKIPAP